jgi:DNA modification methylase
MALVADVKEQFWFGADYYRAHLPSGGGWFVWDKRANDNGMNLDALFGSAFELCWSRQPHKREVIRILWAMTHGRQGEDIAGVHPTQKPTSLARWFIDRWSDPDGIVVDFYGGSGTTVIAAAQSGRVARVSELSPHYCDVIRRRWTRWAKDKGIDPGPGALADEVVP